MLHPVEPTRSVLAQVISSEPEALFFERDACVFRITFGARHPQTKSKTVASPISVGSPRLQRTTRGEVALTAVRDAL